MIKREVQRLGGRNTPASVLADFTAYAGSGIVLVPSFNVRFGRLLAGVGLPARVDGADLGVAGVVLTGMGSDGLRGCEAVRAAGFTIPASRGITRSAPSASSSAGPGAARPPAAPARSTPAASS